MTLQSSGPISLLDVQGEFGGSAPISISEYYGVDTGVPSSGTISLSDFYGTSATPSFTVTVGSYQFGAASTYYGFTEVNAFGSSTPPSNIGARSPTTLYGVTVEVMATYAGKTSGFQIQLQGYNRPSNFFTSYNYTFNSTYYSNTSAAMSYQTDATNVWTYWITAPLAAGDMWSTIVGGQITVNVI